MCTRNECLSILRDNQPQICSEFGVSGMTLFGSVARNENRPDSDIDILVDMPPKIFMLSELKIFLESILKSSVDVVRRHSHLSSSFLNQISHDAVRVF